MEKLLDSSWECALQLCEIKGSHVDRGLAREAEELASFLGSAPDSLYVLGQIP